MKRLIGVVIALALGGALMFAPLMAPCAVAGAYGAGWYDVGEMLPAGEYYFTAYDVPGEQLDAQASVYVYQAYADEYEGEGETGAVETPLVLELFTSTLYVTLSEGQKLEVEGADFIPAAERIAPEAEEGVWPQGMYRGGTDIAPGEYVVTAGEDSELGANIMIYQDSTLLNGSMVLNMFCEPGAEIHVSVAEGQYLRVLDGMFTAAG